MKLSLRILPDPPLSPMTYTREPVVVHFWGGGVLAVLLGFGLGLLLWLQQSGGWAVSDGLLEMRFWHARIQIVLFTGSFLLGFALQAGPNVVGGKPIAAKSALGLFFPLWGGFLISLVPEPLVAAVGNGLISLAFLRGGYLLLRMALGGDPLRLWAIGLPLASGVAILALAPWLALGDPSLGLWAILCGPVTAIFGGSQQLLANVMGGRRIAGREAHLFLFLLVAAWLTASLAAMGILVWSWAILPWLFLFIHFVVAARVVPAARQSGFSSLGVAMIGGLLLLTFSPLLFLFLGDWPVDAVLHLLAVGVVSTLILAVVGRVVSFFSAGYAFPDRVLALMLLAWLLIALTRTAWPLGLLPAVVVPGIVLLAAVLLLVWSLRVIVRLRVIRRLAAKFYA